ncbi:NAD(P)H-hydrate dehydratase [Patescibacteria group bacterium]|nr:NAD(P)H-hydrate dehydratase [Patescibacteria group bacterium]
MRLTTRPATLPKGDWGKLLVLAGSERFAGSAVLTSLGALRTGLDLVVTASPERAANAVLAAAPDAVTIPLAGSEFDHKHFEDVGYFKGYPVAIGSGLTTEPSARKFLKTVLQKFDGPFVIDADALTIIADERGDDWYLDKPVVLTPNREEFEALAGIEGADPVKTVGKVAQDYRAVVLVKGETDVIGDGETIVEVEGGSEFLAKAGTGDVLTGVVGALLARDVPPLDAAKIGAELVKEAGERAGKDKGPSLLASDIPNYLDLRKLS